MSKKPTFARARHMISFDPCHRTIKRATPAQLDYLARLIIDCWDLPGFHRLATSIEEATHKFPTSLHWGEGYFKGMRHIVADSSIAAYETMKHFRKDCDWENLWRREAGKWANCKDLKEPKE